MTAPTETPALENWQYEDDRTALSIETLKRAFADNLFYHTNPQLRAVIDLINSGFFAHGDTNLFKPLVDSLHQDPYMLLADYQSYVDCQERVSQAYRNPENWTRMSILNTARMGKFSSDRAIQEYCRDIWQAEPIKVELAEYVQATAGLKV